MAFKNLLQAVLCASSAISINALVEGPWSDVKKTPGDRAALLLLEMTLDEKIAMLHGQGWQCKTSVKCAYVGNVQSNTRLGIPPITMQDGPQGFRDDYSPGTTTAWPSGLTMAASWDIEAMYEWGVGMGKEFYDKGANVQLGPAVCVARIPRNGRNFEYLSGEDPHLGYVLVQPAVKGIQSQRVMANAKHWVLNNQETNRAAVSELADDRTRFEMYYPPFRGAIEAGVGSFMCGYNKINGVWSCENPITLARDLKERLGFDGYVMSDWGGTHSTSIAAGLDMQQPDDSFMNADKIKAGMEAKNITTAHIDDAISRILRPMFSVGVMDEPVSAWDWKKLQRNVTTAASTASARRLSALSTILLKNEFGILPLQKGKNKLAVIGFANDAAVVHCGGSGSVVPSHVAKPLDGIRAAAGDGATVEFNDGADVAGAASLAKSADYAIVFVGTLSGEGADRKSLSLDDGCDDGAQCKGNAHNQNALVSAIAKVNNRTIVVASVPGAILMPWSNEVAAIITNFMPGQEAGNAIADVLFGRVNPAAKLPLTFPNHENETEFSPAQWPGLPDPRQPVYANYSEGLFVGYRYYDAKGISFTTGFPFGHGLSYTTFKYINLFIREPREATASATVSFTVINTGQVPGAEVAQMYLGFPPSAGEPLLQLKGFKKTEVLAPGQGANIVLKLSAQDFSIWDAEAAAWKVERGVFRVEVGSSSRDLRLSGGLDNQHARELVI